MASHINTTSGWILEMMKVEQFWESILYKDVDI